MSEDSGTVSGAKKIQKLENVTKQTKIKQNRTKIGQFGARRVRGTCLEGSRTKKKSKKCQILGFGDEMRWDWVCPGLRYMKRQNLTLLGPRGRRKVRISGFPMGLGPWSLWILLILLVTFCTFCTVDPHLYGLLALFFVSLPSNRTKEETHLEAQDPHLLRCTICLTSY